MKWIYVKRTFNVAYLVLTLAFLITGAWVKALILALVWMMGYSIKKHFLPAGL